MEGTNKSWLGKLIDWFSNSNITPYVKVRDMSDPIESQLNSVGSDSRESGPSGVEAGIRIRF